MTARQIFTTQTDNGFSEEFTTNGRPFVKIKGTWGSATVSLQAKTNHTNDAFSDTGTDEAFTVDSAFSPEAKQTLIYRLALTGKTATTSIDAFVIV